jgi:hypothetical protein
MTRSHKTVLMAHLDQEQGNAWKLALETQKIQVNLTKADLELATLLDTMVQNQVPLPDLILIDIDIKSKPADRFSERPQAETVCRWIWKTQSTTKVVILNSQVSEISESQYKWGIRQGSAAVLPKLDRENIFTNIQKINDILACEFLADPLQSVFALLPSRTIYPIETEELVPLNPQELDRSNRDQDISTPHAAIPDDDYDEIIYRGVRMKRSRSPRS